MKSIPKFAALTLSVAVLVFSSACEQQSAAVVFPDAYKKQQAAEKAQSQEQSNPNPPTYFGN